MSSRKFSTKFGSGDYPPDTWEWEATVSYLGRPARMVRGGSWEQDEATEYTLFNFSRNGEPVKDPYYAQYELMYAYTEANFWADDPVPEDVQ